jgi:hypothetical protein
MGTGMRDNAMLKDKFELDAYICSPLRAEILKEKKMNIPHDSEEEGDEDAM